MFKLFRKKVDTQAVIAKIHNEFDTAGEKLLMEAKRILSQDVDIDKGERLKKIGFSSTKAVTEAEETLKQKKDSEELAKLIEYYRQWYPSNKFITEEIVEAICKKYNLLCGDASRYKGDVPDKNLKEIEQFKLRDEEKTQRTNLMDYYQMEMMSRMYLSVQGVFSGSRSESKEFNPPKEVRTYLTTPAFKICAPETDFNTMGMTKYGYKLIPDPIVLQPVKGGYLIVSKWGLEASEETLVNEKEN